MSAATFKVNVDCYFILDAEAKYSACDVTKENKSGFQTKNEG